MNRKSFHLCIRIRLVMIMKKQWIAAVAGGVAAGSAVLMANRLFNYAMRRRKESEPDFNVMFNYEPVKQFIPEYEAGYQWIREQSWETITIKSRDGLKLCAEYLPAGESPRTVMLFHGYRSVPDADFSGSCKELHERGYNILNVYERACGKSGGKYITFGIKERLDCVDWINEINRRYGADKDIFLLGVSMGASTVLMASGDELPENVRGIIADCGFTSPLEELKHVAKNCMKLPAVPLVSVVNILSKTRAHCDLSSYSTLTALKNCKVPVFFIHGQMDDFVPPCMTEQNYEACPTEKYILRAANARHGVSWLTDREEYRTMLMDFMNKHSTKSMES